MNAALACAQHAGLILTLGPDGRVEWEASQPPQPQVLAELRRRKEEIRATLLAARKVPQHPDTGDPLADARARGWQVGLRPSGLLVDTCGQPIDRDLMDRVFTTMFDQETTGWPVGLIADPAEVTLRGEVEDIDWEKEG